MAWLVLGALSASACSWIGGDGDARAWFEPLLPDGPETLMQLCAADSCVGDLVVLPALQPIDAAIDLPMPETLGPLTVERLWTGQRGGLFGAGWESIWDLRLDEATIVGPLPAEPEVMPTIGQPVALADGSSVRFGEGGRVSEVCVDGAPCVRATWSDTSVVLQPADSGDVSVTIDLVDGVAQRAVASDGRVVDFVFEDGRLARVVSDGAATSYTYDAGRLTSIDDDAVRRSFTYAGDGVLSAATDRDGRSWRFASDAPGRVMVTSPGAANRIYRFDDARLTSIDDADSGLVLRRSWSDGGLVREERPLDGVVLERLDDGRLQVTQSQDGAPARTARYTLDGLGRVTATESSNGTSTIEYAGRSNRPMRATRNGAVTEFEYDAFGRLTRTVDADGYEVRVERNDVGLPASVADGVVVTEFEYDTAGRAVVERSGDTEWTARYEPNGALRSLTPTGGETWTAAYDGDALRALGDAPVTDAGAQQIDADRVAVGVGVLPSGEVEYRYASGEAAVVDEWSRMLSVTVGNRTTTRSYDDAGRLVEFRRPDGSGYELDYTPAGRMRTITDGSLTANLEWHGDLLLSAITSAGVTYRYTYRPDGLLATATVGEAVWSYDYTATGLVAEVRGPSESSRFGWDDSGRPTEIDRSGRTTDVRWEGDAFDLASIIESGEVAISIGRDAAGRTAAIASADGSSTFEYGTDGELSAYELPGTGRVELEHRDGRVTQLRFGDRSERWTWVDGEVRQVVDQEGQTFDVSWLAPGIPSSIERAGEVLVGVEGDERGRVTDVLDANGESIAELSWTDAGLRALTRGDDRVVILRDGEHRISSVAIGDRTATWTHRAGVTTSVVVDDTVVHHELRDGKVSASRTTFGDDEAVIEWDADAGRPLAFSSTEGAGRFDYDGERVATVRYDDRVRDVSFDDEGRASAEGTGQELLDDLFTDDGRFRSFGGSVADGPTSPWFEALPAEVGLRLPDVMTADDIVREALALAAPDLPAPLIGNADGVADRLAESIVSIASTVPVHVGPDRAVDLVFAGQGDDDEFAPMLAASPAVGIGDSVLTRLAGGDCLVCRVTDFVGGVAGDVRALAGDVSGFVTDNPVARAVATAAFFVGSFAAGLLCGAGLACGLALIVGPIALSLLADSGVGVLAAIAAATIDPFLDLAAGVRSGEPAAVLTAVGLVAAFVAGRGSSAVASSVRAGAVRSACSLRRVVCVSASRFGAAAEHVADAQRLGAPRVLRLDRAGAIERRQSALRNVPTRIGFDRDEYPFAVSSRRASLSIRYVDPTSNRSLGAFIGRQLSPLPDGARFWVVPIA